MKKISLLVTLALAGCGSKIDCNDSELKKLAIQIIQERMANVVWYKQASHALTPANLTDIQTISKNNETKQGACKANYTFEYNEKQRQIPIEYSLSYLEDSGKTQVSLDPDIVFSNLMGLVMFERPRSKEGAGTLQSGIPPAPSIIQPSESATELGGDDEPNGKEEAKNKQQGKEWQDNNGFIHYPDGTKSDRPVD